MLSLLDTAHGTTRELRLRAAGKVSMYVCGPTVYGPPHLGHGRFSLVFDVLRRYLLWSGFDVTYVSNITDIDDKIIERANAEGRPWQDITAECEEQWWAAMDGLGVLRPDEVPHATEYVDRMVDLIGRLLEVGAAYETADGVYFRPNRVADYGLLARQDVDSLQAGARVGVGDQKESPIDFALWKFAKPGEPSWEAPWGAGRPGWHTECVVMSLDLLGDGFDIHGGGMDLAFPHHENERAQAVALGHHFATHWVHNGFVEVGGEKMSKSLGNFTNLADLLARSDPRAYRMLCLQAHYRSPIDVNEKTAANAAHALARLDSLARRLGARPDAEPDPATLERFRAAMDDDLDTPAAMGIIFGATSELNRRLDAGEPEPSLAAAWYSMLSAVGLEVGTDSEEAPPEVAALAAERDAARAARDFARADALRDQLVAEGWIVEDTAEGTAVRHG